MFIKLEVSLIFTFSPAGNDLFFTLLGIVIMLEVTLIFSLSLAGRMWRKQSVRVELGLSKHVFQV